MRKIKEKSILDKKSAGEVIVFIIVAVVFLAYAVTMIFPLVWLVMSSLKDTTEYALDIMNLEPFALPDKLKLKTVDNKNKVLSAVKDIQNLFSHKRMALANSFEKVTSIISKLNPLEILKSGYALIEKDDKKLSSVKNLKQNDNISIRLADGKVDAVVRLVEENKGE